MSEEENNDSQEKSFEATEQRLREAREKGNVPQSMEVNTVLLYIGMAVAIMMTGAGAAQTISERMAGMFSNPKVYGDQLLYNTDKSLFADTVMDIVGAMGPIFLIPAVFIVVSLVAQQAVVFAPSKIKPKLSKISPISNAKQKYGPDGLVEFVKSTAKLTAISVVAGIFLWQQYPEFPQMSQLSATVLPLEMMRRSLLLFLFVIIIFTAIAALDLPWKRYSHAKKLRMSFQDIKEENKKTEGDPTQKAARRARAQEIALNSMIRDVQKADVVIVNPTHYAVALKWERTRGTVPVCLAKGVDEIAMRIRAAAKEAGVAIHSDPPSARSLYATVEIGEAIQPEHYAAVAAAIHFADQLKKSE